MTLGRCPVGVFCSRGVLATSQSGSCTNAFTLLVAPNRAVIWKSPPTLTARSNQRFLLSDSWGKADGFRLYLTESVYKVVFHKSIPANSFIKFAITKDTLTVCGGVDFLELIHAYIM